MTSQPRNTLNRGGFLALAGTVAGVTGLTISTNFATSGNPAWPGGLPPSDAP